MSKNKLPEPVGKKLLLEIQESTAGAIGVHQGAQIQEIGTILKVGPKVNNINPDLKTGTVILFKAWQIDIITIDKEKYYFMDADGDALCAIMK
jgi:co-chaperonin GroES (HSP10)